VNARDIRLRNDFESLLILVDQSLGALEIETSEGRPPDQYVVIYRCRSIESLSLKDGNPVYSDMHRMRIRLPARYPLPSAPPRLEMLTPLYNPHIYPNLQVCLGNWQTTEYLDELVARVGALIQLDRRILNLRDPANPEAMDWVKKNLLLVPTDVKVFGPQNVVSQSILNPKVLNGIDPQIRSDELPDMAKMATENDSEIEAQMEWVDS